MNFLLRSAQHVPRDAEVPDAQLQSDGHPIFKRTTTLEGLISEDPLHRSSSEDGDGDNDGIGDGNVAPVSSSLENQSLLSNHSDVTDDEGWITIPCRELPDDWTNASDILQLRSLDRSFVFPGEQIHLLVCLSASKQDVEIITPFKVAAVISKNNGSTKKQSENLEDKPDSGDSQGCRSGAPEDTAEGIIEENGESSTGVNMCPALEAATESLLRMEEHKHQTEKLLEKFRNSNFFVRIAEVGEPLWSKRNVADESASSSETSGGNFHMKNAESTPNLRSTVINAVIDRGSFDGNNTSGGVARNPVRCYTLRNGDIVVLLQVNVAISSDIKDPVLEVLQFEKYEAAKSAPENQNGLAANYKDPCQELLNWLLPLDRTLPAHPSYSATGSTSVVGVTQRSTSTTVPSSSQIFSFNQLRSYSMPAIPQGSVSPAIPQTYSRPSGELEDYDRFLREKVLNRETGNNGLLSFRGVPLEPDRFSVHCGLEGIYLPRRRWRRKLEIVQPLEIHSFVAECTTEDYLCVQVKNVSPAHLPDIVIYLDAISIIFDEASSGGRPLSLPIASIETGNGYSLPNLSLRRGEEHSFILRPAITNWKDIRGHDERKPTQSHQRNSSSTPKAHLASRVNDGKMVSPCVDQYSVLVSCRCNYTQSKLFIKHPTSWRPRIARDIMISIVSDMSHQTVAPDDKVPQLPVQVLTLQASNLTSEDLTLTVLAPVASDSSPSVVSSNSGPTTPNSSFPGLSEANGRSGFQKLSSMPVETEAQNGSNDSRRRSVSLAQRTGATSDVISSSGLGYTHLWLRSTIPLGCVPAGSSATVKLELLPLTDGMITLDTLEVAIKEKGLTYKPEQPLRIQATSSLSRGVF